MTTGKLVGTSSNGTGSCGANSVSWSKFIATASGIVSEIHVYALASGNVKVAIYDDSSNYPGNKITGNDAPQAVTLNQWNTLTIGNTNVVKNTVYWLACIADTEGAFTWLIDAQGRAGYKAATFSGFTWPAAAGGGLTGPNDGGSYVLAGWGILVLSPTGISQVIALGQPTIQFFKYIVLAAGIEQLISIGTPVLQTVSVEVPDLPDWMDSMNIVAARLNLPMLIKGADITLPIDVRAVTVGTLSVDIIAQTVGNLAVSIAAQVGNLTMSVAAQTVGIYLQPEWAASQQTDKNFRASQGSLSYGAYGYSSYPVPTGKTLFITHIGGYSFAQADTDADKNQIMAISIYDTTAASYLFESGGNGGAFANFNKPIRIPAGHTVWFMAWNFANHVCTVSVSASGYEV